MIRKGRGGEIKESISGKEKGAIESRRSYGKRGHYRQVIRSAYVASDEQKVSRLDGAPLEMVDSLLLGGAEKDERKNLPLNGVDVTEIFSQIPTSDTAMVFFIAAEYGCAVIMNTRCVTAIIGLFTISLYHGKSNHQKRVSQST